MVFAPNPQLNRGALATPMGSESLTALSESKTKRRTQAERRGEAEASLVEAAIKLLAKRGYDGFTLADVGEAAGYSRGLPAHYFGRKEDLLVLVAQRAVDAYHLAVARLPPADPGLPRIAALVRCYVQSGNNRGRRAMSLLISEAIVRPELKQTINDLNAQGLASLRSELEAGVNAGNVRSDVNLDHQAKLIYAFLRGQMTFAVLEANYDGEAVGEEFIATLQARLAGPPAHAADTSDDKLK
jgi:AcrR family transcriptional regulator